MKFLSTLLVFGILTTPIQSTNAHSHKKEDLLCQGFIPENDLWIDVNDKSKNAAGLSEEEFNEVIDEVVKVYEPIVKSKGGNLIVKRLWDNGTVNASAMRQGNDYIVNMYGGLARHETVTADGFAMVVCHEVGHHIGGAPVYGASQSSSGGWGGGGSSANSWASTEGQSDYFAASKCLRKAFKNDNNAEIVAMLDVPEYVKQSCEKNFKNNDDFMLCARAAMAGLSLANLFKALRKLEVPLSFQTPDTKVVSKTYEGHPQPQCRLDTYFQASVCEADDRIDLGYEDEAQGACARVNNQKFGARPLCWYKPQKSFIGQDHLAHN